MRKIYRYQAFQGTAATTAIHRFTITSNIGCYCLFYQSLFDPDYASERLLQSDSESINNKQSICGAELAAGQQYVLVVNILNDALSGPFHIRAYNPLSINLTAFTPTYVITNAAGE
jgi:hypothetical protein